MAANLVPAIMKMREVVAHANLVTFFVTNGV